MLFTFLILLAWAPFAPVNWRGVAPTNVLHCSSAPGATKPALSYSSTSAFHVTHLHSFDRMNYCDLFWTKASSNVISPHKYLQLCEDLIVASTFFLFWIFGNQSKEREKNAISIFKAVFGGVKLKGNMPYNFQFAFMGCQHNYLARVTKISSSGVPQDASITRT